MRNRNSIVYSFVMLVLVLFILMSMPKRIAEKTRGLAMAVAAPSFQMIHKIKEYFKKSTASHDPFVEEIERLQSENKILNSLLQQTQELLENEVQLKYYIEMLKKNDDEALDWLEQQANYRHSHLRSFVETKVQSVPAKIIFRSPGTWNSSAWINIGSENNLSYGYDIIQKNSPVLSGDSIVGIIDYVGKRQSRIKFITDSGLSPSVRVVRKKDGKVLYLAKGELHGNSQPIWSSKSSVLEGIGFNYDFADDEGPARDLRTGEPLNDHHGAATMPIIAIDDLLVTTGMDGVFPPGLSIATVTHIEMLREGDYFYTIKASPTFDNLDDLSLVFIAPPYGYDETDQSPL